MKLGEKGFTYPITLCMLLLFSFFLTMNLQLFLAEKRVLSQTKIILQQEYYMFSSVKKIEELLRINETANRTGTINYDKGALSYGIEPVVDGTLRVTMTLTLTTGEQFLGIGIYDKTAQRMVKWTERN